MRGIGGMVSSVLESHLRILQVKKNLIKEISNQLTNQHFSRDFKYGSKTRTVSCYPCPHIQ